MTRFWHEFRNCVQPAPAAELFRAGVTRDMLRGPRWIRTGRGFYRPATSSAPTATQRIIDVAALLPPGAAIGGWAAGYALGADILDGLDDHTMQPIPISVLLPPGLHRHAIAQVRYVQQTRATAYVTTIGDIPFTKPYRTALDLGCWAPNVTEAVVALDALLKARIISVAGLERALSSLRGRPGNAAARRAIALSRPGVRSPWESRLRMFWVLELALPSPRVNQPVFDLYGNFLGVPDLLDVDAGLAIEYDGASWASGGGHRDPHQHREDNVREELLERAGLIVVRADKVDLTRHRARLAQRLAGARADGLARDHWRDRWTVREPPDWLGLPA